MKEVLLNICYCPMNQDLQVRTCINPPNKEVLIAKVAEYIGVAVYQSEDDYKKADRIMFHILRNPPPNDWLLKLLSAIKPDDEVFVKGYQPP